MRCTTVAEHHRISFQYAVSIWQLLHTLSQGRQTYVTLSREDAERSPENGKRSDDSDRQLNQMQHEILPVHASRKQEDTDRRRVVQRHLLEVERQTKGDAAQKLVILKNERDRKRSEAQAHIVVLFIGHTRTVRVVWVVCKIIRMLYLEMAMIDEQQ